MAGDAHFDSVVLLFTGYPVLDESGNVTSGAWAADYSPAENDLVVTSLGGARVGRYTYDAKREIPGTTFDHVFAVGRDRFVAPYTTNFDFSTRDWTIETYIWTGKGDTTVTATQEQFGTVLSKSSAASNVDLMLYQDLPNMRWMFNYGTAANANQSLNLGPLAAARAGLSHVAVVRQGNVITGYVDGVPGGSVTLTQPLLNRLIATEFFNRTTVASTTFLLGICAGIRITMGVARYTSAFTPEYTNFPHYKTTPGDRAEQEAAIPRATELGDPHYSRVVALLEKPGRLGTKVIEDDKDPSYTWRARGTAFVDKNSPLPTKSAMSFDGTTGVSSAAFIRNDPRMYFTSDFTIEFKFRVRAFTNNICGLIQSANWMTYSGALTMTARKLTLYNNNWYAGTLVWTQPVELELNRTYTFCLQQRGQLLYIFLDGVIQDIITNRGYYQWHFNQGGGCLFGASPSNANNSFNGWIGNIRVTDAARYYTNYDVGNAWYARNLVEEGFTKYRLYAPMPVGYDKALSIKHLALVGPSGPITTTMSCNHAPSEGVFADLASLTNNNEVVYSKEKLAIANLYFEFDAPGNTTPVRTLAVKTSDDITEALRHAKLRYMRPDGVWENHPYKHEFMESVATNAVHLYKNSNNALAPDSIESIISTGTTMSFDGTHGTIVRTTTTTNPWPRMSTRRPLQVGNFYVEITPTSDDPLLFGVYYATATATALDGIDHLTLWGNGKYVTGEEGSSSYFVTDRKVAKNKTVGVMMNIGVYWACVTFVVDGKKTRTIRWHPTNGGVARNWHFVVSPSALSYEGTGLNGQRNVAFTFSDGSNVPFVYPLPANYTPGFNGMFHTSFVDAAYTPATIDINKQYILPISDDDYHDEIREKVLTTSGLDQYCFGYIKNYCYNDGDPLQPVRRKIMLYDVLEARVVESMWSEEGTGLYQFTWLSLTREYLVLAHDHTRNRTSAIAGPLRATRIPNSPET